MKICVVTGSRADYGYLSTLMRLVRDHPGCELQVAATGMHLWKEFGETWREVEQDGFSIDARVAAPFTGTASLDVARYVGGLVPGFAEAFASLAPDFAVVLGDRYEIFAAAQAALFMRIPLAHLAGGDVTEGAYDEAMRHAITKMAALHFPTNEDSASRIINMGEDPSRVHAVGSTSLDALAEFTPLGRKELEKRLDFALRGENLLVTFHPVTLSGSPSENQARELLAALDDWAGAGDKGVIITAPNADTDGMRLKALYEEFAGQRSWVKVFDSLGRQKYFSAMTHVDAVVGNSSSGLYEAPSFAKPSVDIGDRQKGRIRAESVAHCEPRRGEILAAIEKACAMDASGAVNPYGRGDASKRILDVLLGVNEPRTLIKKSFYEAT